MSYKVFLLMGILILNSCANYRPAPKKVPLPPKKRSVMAKTAKISKVKEPKKEVKVTRAVFHLVHPLGVELLVNNTADGQTERILIDKTLSQLEMSPGQWEIDGFILDGKAYEAQNDSQRFSFEVKANEATYVGSYIIQCPKVGREHMPEMKKMIFFNRYTMVDSEGLCEMVVGNAHSEVNKVWKKLIKSKRSLKLGF